MSRVSGRAVQQLSSSRKALLGTIVGSGWGFVLPFAITSHFGVSRLTDVYFFAFAVATFGTGLISVTIETNALPEFQARKLAGSSAFSAGLRRLLIQMTIAATVIAGALLLVGLVLVNARHDWAAAERMLATRLLLLFCILVVAVAVTSVAAAATYAAGDFLGPTMSQGFRSILPLGAVAFVGGGRIALVTLAALAVVGESLRAAVLFARLRRLRARWPPSPAATADVVLRRMWRATLPAAFSMLVASANPLIDRAIAASLAAGSLTLLDLGERILYVPLVALTSSTILVGGTRWAEMSEAGDPSLASDFKTTARRVIQLSAIMAGAISLSVGALALLPGDRLFGAHDTQLWIMVTIFIVSLPGAAIINAGTRLIAATRRTRALPMISFAAVAANLVGDLIGAALIGVYGIAVASSIVRALFAVVFLVWAHRILDGHPGDRRPPLAASRNGPC